MNPSDCTSKDTLRTTTSYFDMYDSAIMKHHLFYDRRQEDPLPQYARGFASTQVPHDARDAFAANDDFVPFVADS